MDGKPGILHDLLGLGVIADNRGGNAHQRGMEAADEAPMGVWRSPPWRQGLGPIEPAVVPRTPAHAALTFPADPGALRVTCSLASGLTKRSIRMQATWRFRSVVT